MDAKTLDVNLFFVGSQTPSGDGGTQPLTAANISCTSRLPDWNCREALIVS